MAIVKINNCGQGVNYDLMAEEIAPGMWSDVQNMRFRNGFAERFRGLTNIFGTPSAIPYWITPYGTASTRYWIHAGLANVYADDGTTRTEITPASAPTGAIDDRWTGGVLNGVLVMNNGKDVPLFWGGNVANDLATLTGWDANERCKALRPFKNYLIALNITKTSTNFPHMVKWSDAAVPGSIPASWDETSVTGDAGENEIAETPDLIVDGLPLGDAFIIYKERSAYSMTFIGQPQIFRFQRLPGEYGMLARGCVANTPLGHVVLTSGDIVLNNGQGMASIADGFVREYIFRTMNTVNAQRSFVCTNPQKSEVLICYPSSESDICDKAAVWNWKDKTWGFRDLPDVTYGDAGQINTDATLLNWDSDSDVWDSDPTVWSENEYAANEARLLFSRDTGITAFDVGTTDLGTNITSMLERKAITFDDPYSNKVIRSLYPRFDAPKGTILSISVGGAMYAKDDPVYSAAVSFSVGEQIKIDAFATGRFLAVKIEANDYAPWRLRSLDLDVVTTGAY